MAQLAILILIGVIWLIFKGISDASSSAAAASRRQQLDAKAKEKWKDRSVDLTQTLAARNEDIIQKHLKRVHGGYQRHYYVENLARDCVQDIAEAEGKSSLGPGYTYLSTWLIRANPEYKALAEGILTRLRARKSSIDAEEKERANIVQKQKNEELRTKYASLISQFNEITHRRVSLRDDYGEENWDVLEQEVQTLIQKIAKREGKTDESIRDWKKSEWRMPEEYKELSSYLKRSFRDYHAREARKPVSANVEYEKMSGVEFEAHLMKLLSSRGFIDVKGTPATGDQGADLLAKKDGKTIVIQAKCYSGTVGNKAVQEVVSAVRYYSGDEGWVITNSTFTKSAKELAQKTGVKLVEGYDLKRM